MATRVGLGLVGRFLGNAVSESFAFAAGVAIGPVLGPPTQALRNTVNSAFPFVPVAPGVLAEGVAQGQIEPGIAATIASHSGINQENFDHMVAIAKAGPGSGFAFELWRRGEINEAGFRRALLRVGIEDEWISDLVKLKIQLLSPGEIAASIHRGLVPDPGILLGEQPSGPRKVASYPVQQIDAIAEAAGSGYDKERLAVLVGLQGLPMGVIEAAQAYYRGDITHGDYIAAFNESNNRNEWAQAVLDYARQIPTARDYIENALRGYRTFEEAATGAARHGMSEADARLIFQNSGRPLNLHQITQALEWGAKYNPQPGDDPDPYMNAVLIGAVTPAYYEMQDTLKYNLPSALYFRTLQQQNVLTEAEADKWYRRLGWPPDLAAKVAKAYAKPAATEGDPHVAKAQVQLWTTTHASYKGYEISAPTATTALAKAGVTTAAIPTVLDIWDAERALIRARLTASDIRKAYRKQDENPATGAAWTRPDAIAQLLELGYANEDAEAYLNIG